MPVQRAAAMPVQRRRALATLSLLCTTQWDACTAVTVDSFKKHKQGDMDEDEYLWNKLAGRCCFELNEVCPFQDSPREDCTKSSPATCKECSIWSEPDNYCHLSAENCLSCGMQLYCPKPPPLLDGNKVCTKTSRVGEGCFDTRGTGLCAAHDFSDCEDACRVNSACQLFIYYPEEMQGSCVLCRDLFSFDRTTDAATRAYAVTVASPPPAPTVSQPRKYSFVSDFPPPRHPTTKPPPPPTSLGQHRISGGHEHTECTFDEGIEYTVEKEQGYETSTARVKEECCSLCGRTAGCTDFVFEPSSGTCVLLPHVTSESEIEAWPNPTVVSGSVRISIAPIIIPSSSCSFSESTGYTMGELGNGKPVPGSLMLTKEDCCLSCGAAPLCAKFTFDPGAMVCILHEAYAEVVKVEFLISGTVTSKLVGQGEIFERLHGGHNASAGRRAYPPPPGMPEFLMLSTAFSSPPPPLKLSDGSTTELVISRVSFSIFLLMVVALLICAYCYLSPTLLRMAYQISGGKMGKRLDPKFKHQHNLVPVTDHEMLPALMPPGGPDDELPPGHARVTAETASMTQSLEIDVSVCGDLPTLRSLFVKSFGAMMKGVKPSETTIFCLAAFNETLHEDDADGEEEELMWCLVTVRSDFTRVVTCAEFRLLAGKISAAEKQGMSIAFDTSMKALRHSGQPRLMALECEGCGGHGTTTAPQTALVPRKRKDRRKVGRGCTRQAQNVPSDSSSDDNDEQALHNVSLDEDLYAPTDKANTSSDRQRSLVSDANTWDDDDGGGNYTRGRVDDLF